MIVKIKEMKMIVKTNGTKIYSGNKNTAKNKYLVCYLMFQNSEIQVPYIPKEF